VRFATIALARQFRRRGVEWFAPCSCAAPDKSEGGRDHEASFVQAERIIEIGAAIIRRQRDHDGPRGQLRGVRWVERAVDGVGR
jgi:hypothetical protein